MRLEGFVSLLGCVVFLVCLLVGLGSLQRFAPESLMQVEKSSSSLR